MHIRNSDAQFGLLSKALHWLIAVLILFLIWLGWYMVDLGYYDRWYNRSLELHKSLGMIVLAVAAVKVGWQGYSPVPAPVATLRPREMLAARIMHGLLLVAMVLLPVTGYLISTSAGAPVPVFDWLKIPPVFAKSETLRDWAIELHYWMAYTTALLVAAHAGAALKHQFVNRDGTLARMIWR